MARRRFLAYQNNERRRGGIQRELSFSHRERRKGSNSGARSQPHI
jgi:hypothetical protein